MTVWYSGPDMLPGMMVEIVTPPKPTTLAVLVRWGKRRRHG